MNTLDKIIAHKRHVVEQNNKDCGVSALIEYELYNRTTTSLVQALLASGDTPGIISEFKRRSPSKGDINISASVNEVTAGYEKAGAAGISVLTDTKYFGGSNQDLIEARSTVDCPILRKDFTINPYQVHEAKAIGADVILLIAAVLSTKEIVELSALAHDLNLEVLLEVHGKEELDPKYFGSIDILGVNNRNLKTFETSIENSLDIYASLPEELLKISESGLASMKEISILQDKGYQGFLIGEQFMKHDDPPAELAKFLKVS